MAKKILVVDHAVNPYGKAVAGLGELTNNVVEFTNRPDLFSLVLFTGGADVDPSFYSETSPENYCVSDAKRDEREAHIWNDAVEAGVKCVGICRGLQFLNVMNGGRMMHHLTGHEGGSWHEFETPTLGYLIRVNSLHHQMIIPAKDCHVLGWSPQRLSEVYVGDKDQVVEWPGPEIESAWYPETGSAGVQYHPEMMAESTPGYKWFQEMASDLVLMERKDFMEKYVRKANVCANA